MYPPCRFDVLASLDVSGWKVTFEFMSLVGVVGENSQIVFYDWCVLNFGKPNYSVSVGKWRWRLRGTYPIVLSFRYRKDAMMFKLHWAELVDMLPKSATFLESVNTE